MKSQFTQPRPPFARAKLVALVAASLVVAAPVARAQGLFELFEASPRQVARSIEDSGYSIRGPLIRRGDVYVCDAVSDSGRHVRLVVDAHNGQVIERFAERRPAWRERDDVDAPRPPRDVYGSRDEDPDGPQRFARGSIWDEPLPGSSGSPTVIPGIGKPAPENVEPPKPRPHVVKRRPAAPPVSTAKAAPEKAAPDAPNPSPSPTEAAAPPEPTKPTAPAVAAVAPSEPAHPAPDVTPVAPEPHKAAAEPVKAPVEAAKPVTPKPVISKSTSETKPASETKPTETKPVSEAKAADAKPAEVKTPEVKPAADVKPGQKKLNDLPVSPLD